MCSLLEGRLYTCSQRSKFFDDLKKKKGMPSFAPTGFKDAHKNLHNNLSKGGQQSLEQMMAYEAKEPINQMQA